MSERPRALAAAALVTVAMSLAAPPAAAADTVVIGSKDFAENRILAHAMAQLIEARTDLEVELQDGLGGTLFVFEALRAGDIDVYPEYTGTGWSIVLKQTERAGAPLATYATVAEAYRRRFGVRWMAPFGFSNSYALAVREDVAEELDLHTISDLVPHAGTLRAGVTLEFLNREDGWPGISAAYGLEMESLRGMEHALAFQAIDDGEIDVIDAWTTDGKLLRYDLRVLEDDRAFWPPYHAAPIAREDTLARHPELADALGLLALRLDDARMQELNAAVEIEGRSFAVVAREFLVAEGLLEAGDVSDLSLAGDRSGDLLAFAWRRLPSVLALTWEHLLLTLGAVAAAVAVAVPGGVALVRRPRASALVLGVAGVIQTVPSLALLAFMIPVLGLGVDAAYAALFLYSLLPILRNTTTGLSEVDEDLIEAAVGMGLTSRQVMLRVRLPLAVPTIMAGIRVATVITIGVATLAAFIGAGGLGEPIVTGLQLADTRLVLSGAVPAALLAVVVDLALGRVERRLTARRVA